MQSNFQIFQNCIFDKFSIENSATTFWVSRFWRFWKSTLRASFSTMKSKNFRKYRLFSNSHWPTRPPRSPNSSPRLDPRAAGCFMWVSSRASYARSATARPGLLRWVMRVAWGLAGYGEHAAERKKSQPEVIGKSANARNRYRDSTSKLRYETLRNDRPWQSMTA